MKKEYYIQGDPARAEEIKAAFERLGINVLDFGFADKTVVYCSIGGECVQYLPYSINLMNILYSHPDYRELELTVKPNFKVGDWITDGACKVKITDINNTNYWYSKNCILGEIESIDKKYHLWTIQDAKDGDVLATDNGWTCIFQAFDGCVFSSYCFMDSEKWFFAFGSEAHTPDSRINGNIHPATKEQCDQIFKKMKEADYTWDEEKKELKKISKHYDISNFHAGMPVLVRADNNCRWDYSIFSRITGNEDWKFAVCNGVNVAQCIPFEGNEHLLGTTDMCAEEFINW